MSDSAGSSPNRPVAVQEGSEQLQETVRAIAGMIAPPGARRMRVPAAEVETGRPATTVVGSGRTTSRFGIFRTDEVILHGDFDGPRTAADSRVRSVAVYDTWLEYFHAPTTNDLARVAVTFRRGRAHRITLERTGEKLVAIDDQEYSWRVTTRVTMTPDGRVVGYEEFTPVYIGVATDFVPIDREAQAAARSNGVAEQFIVDFARDAGYMPGAPVAEFTPPDR